MDFECLKQTVGLNDAVLICRNNLPIAVFDQISDQDLIPLPHILPRDCMLYQDVLRRLNAINDFEFWQTAFNNPKLANDSVILNGLSRTAKTFEQWHFTFKAGYTNHDRFIAINKMIKLAENYGDWRIILYCCRSIHCENETERAKIRRLEQAAFRKTVKLATTFDDATHTFLGQAKNRYEKMAVITMTNTAKTFHQWSWVWEKAPLNSRASRKAVDQMVLWAMTFGEWMRVYHCVVIGSPDLSDVSAVAYDHMKKLARGREDWLNMYNVKHKGIIDQALVIKNILKLSGSLASLVNVCHRAPNNSELEKAALEKLSAKKYTAKHWIKIQQQIGLKPQINEIVRLKIAEQIQF